MLYTSYQNKLIVEFDFKNGFRYYFTQYKSSFTLISKPNLVGFFFEDCRLFLVVEKMKENLKRIKWNVRRELTFLYDLTLECLLFLLFAREGFGWDFWERKLIHIYTHINIHIHIHIYTYTHTHLYTYTHKHTYIYTYTYTYTYTYIFSSHLRPKNV